MRMGSIHTACVAPLSLRGMPDFVFDRTYGVSGAQEAAVLAEVLQRAWSEAAAPAES